MGGAVGELLGAEVGLDQAVRTGHAELPGAGEGQVGAAEGEGGAAEIVGVDDEHSVVSNRRGAGGRGERQGVEHVDVQRVAGVEGEVVDRRVDVEGDDRGDRGLAAVDEDVVGVDGVVGDDGGTPPGRDVPVSGSGLPSGGLDGGVGERRGGGGRDHHQSPAPSRTGPPKRPRLLPSHDCLPSPQVFRQAPRTKDDGPDLCISRSKLSNLCEMTRSQVSSRMRARQMFLEAAAGFDHFMNRSCCAGYIGPLNWGSISFYWKEQR